jgi:hypothetical protein
MAERAGVYASPADDILLEAIMLKLILASSLATIERRDEHRAKYRPCKAAPPA